MESSLEIKARELVDLYKLEYLSKCMDCPIYSREEFEKCLGCNNDVAIFNARTIIAEME